MNARTLCAPASGRAIIGLAIINQISHGNVGLHVWAQSSSFRGSYCWEVHKNMGQKGVPFFQTHSGYLQATGLLLLSCPYIFRRLFFYGIEGSTPIEPQKVFEHPCGGTPHQRDAKISTRRQKQALWRAILFPLQQCSGQGMVQDTRGYDGVLPRVMLRWVLHIFWSRRPIRGSWT